MKLIKVFLWLGLMLYIAFLVKVILIKHLPLPFLIQNLNLGLNFNQMNFIPFATIADYFATENTGISLRNLVGNVIIFIPLGILLPILIQRFRKIIVILLVSFGFSLLVETIQLLFSMLGSFDVDDLILNTSGALIGYWGFVTLKNFGHNKMPQNS
jgi:glycopeptide antibiotics resistance protein